MRRRETQDSKERRGGKHPVRLAMAETGRIGMIFAAQCFQ